MNENLFHQAGIVIGAEGKGKSMIDTLLKNKMLINNYRKRQHLPLIRKGSPFYELRRSLLML